jgi:hypothetical protein
VWTAQAAITAGTSITLPNSMQYVVGAKQLRVAVNGVILMKPQNFAEVGTAGDVSTTITIAFDLAEGDEIMAWTVPFAGPSVVTTNTTQTITGAKTFSDLSAATQAAGDSSTKVATTEFVMRAIAAALGQ